MTENPSLQFVNLKVTYLRDGNGIYLSHLDVVDVMSRAIRRARLPYRISQGCHVRPKVAFGPPLPLGHSSRCEFLQLHLETLVDPGEVLKRLANQLPSGFTILSVALWSKDEPTGNKIRYHIGFRPGAEAVLQKSRGYLADPTNVIIMHRGSGDERLPLGEAVLAMTDLTGLPYPTLQVDFQQGIKGIPSAGRILTALTEYLGPSREDLLKIERNAFLP